MLNLAEKYKHIIADFRVRKYVNEESLFACKVVIIFSDNSVLDVKEYRFTNHERKYSFHWMDRNKKMRTRWDNASHWKNISTFPHHKHTGKKIVASTEITLEQVLSAIEKQLLK